MWAGESRQLLVPHPQPPASPRAGGAWGGGRGWPCDRVRPGIPLPALHGACMGRVCVGCCREQRWRFGYLAASPFAVLSFVPLRLPSQFLFVPAAPPTIALCMACAGSLLMTSHLSFPRQPPPPPPTPTHTHHSPSHSLSPISLLSQAPKNLRRPGQLYSVVDNSSINVGYGLDSVDQGVGVRTSPRSAHWDRPLLATFPSQQCSPFPLSPSPS